ncbi:hypothetical protein RvY_14145 [Ramazzottius varieornatus]|uniref:Uncharacterized protein n=1 Tax=Ramazzottius varieornatus TaxID=947166 RepID=A0A1D1VQB9_RAMVA|nr:hypothetical protein RvY_14145 [Ramazzottius varieornatus]
MYTVERIENPFDPKDTEFEHQTIGKGVIKINKNYRINGAPVEPHDLEYINSIIDMYNRRLQRCMELHEGDYIGLKHPGSFT